MLIQSYMLPAAGLLTDISILITVLGLKDRRTYDRPLLTFYSLTALWNLHIMLLFLLKSESDIEITTYIFQHFLPPVFFSFLWLSMELSGRFYRRLFIAALATALAMTALVDYSFWLTPDNRFFHAGFKRYSFGYYPILSTGTKLLNFYSLFCISTGLFFLIRPNTEMKRCLPMKRISILAILFWLGILTNFFPVWGFSIYPIGNAVDAVVSAILAFVIYQNVKMNKIGFYTHRIAGIFTVASAALLVSYLLTELILPDSKFMIAITGVISGLIGMTVYHFRFQPSRSNLSQSPSLQPLLLKQFKLTHRETEICTYLNQGLSREFICERLKIKPATMKLHLKSIYRKTIEQDGDIENSTVNRRDKLQRLTVFLSGLKNHDK